MGRTQGYCASSNSNSEQRARADRKAGPLRVPRHPYSTRHRSSLERCKHAISPVRSVDDCSCANAAATVLCVFVFAPVHRDTLATPLPSERTFKHQLKSWCDTISAEGQQRPLFGASLARSARTVQRNAVRCEFKLKQVEAYETASILRNSPRPRALARDMYVHAFQFAS